MLRKILNIVVLVPLGILLVVLCVANRQAVTLAFNPFDPADTVLAITGPFFMFLFLAAILGIVIGASATWIGQGKYRKRSRVEAREALKWHMEAENRKTQAEPVPPTSVVPAQRTLARSMST